MFWWLQQYILLFNTYLHLHSHVLSLQDTTNQVARNQMRTLMDVAALNSRVVMEMKPEPVKVGVKDGAKAVEIKEV